MARGWKPCPVRNRVRAGEKVMPESPARRLVTGHRAAEAWLSRGCRRAPSEAAGCRKPQGNSVGPKSVAELCHFFGPERDYSLSERVALWTEISSNPCSAAFWLHDL